MSRRGNKAFDKCDVKIVEFKEHVYKKGDEGKPVVSSNPSEDVRTFFGNSAVCIAPRTEDDGVSVESQFSDHDTNSSCIAKVYVVWRGHYYARLVASQL